MPKVHHHHHLLRPSVEVVVFGVSTISQCMRTVGLWSKLTHKRSEAGAGVGILPERTGARHSLVELGMIAAAAEGNNPPVEGLVGDSE